MASTSRGRNSAWRSSQRSPRMFLDSRESPLSILRNAESRSRGAGAARAAKLPSEECMAAAVLPDGAAKGTRPHRAASLPPLHSFLRQFWRRRARPQAPTYIQATSVPQRASRTHTQTANRIFSKKIKSCFFVLRSMFMFIVLPFVSG